MFPVSGEALSELIDSGEVLFLTLSTTMFRQLANGLRDLGCDGRRTSEDAMRRPPQQRWFSVSYGEGTVRRLMAYQAGLQAIPAGARGYSASIDIQSESFRFDERAAARSIHHSGAADLLRPYRRA